MSKGEIRFIVVGKTGNGKSSTCNSIAGRPSPPLFFQTASSTSVTKRCQFEVVCFDGYTLAIVDTPGLYDTDLKQEETLNEIGKVMGITAPGFHAFVIVVAAAGRFTAEEKHTVDLLVEKFGPELYERAVVLFTGVDNLEADGVSFKEFVVGISQANLRHLISKCGNRCVGFNNRAKGRELNDQVKHLMQSIEQIMTAKKGTYYTNEIYKAVEQRFQLERITRMEKERKSEAIVTNEMRHEVEKGSPGFGASFLNFFKNLNPCTIL